MAVRSLAVILFSLFVHSACQRPAVADGPGVGEVPTLVQWLQTQPDASDFLAILEFSGLAGLVEEQPEITVVVPTNAGLAAFFPGAEDLLQDQDLARRFIRMHCIQGPAISAAVLQTLSNHQAGTLLDNRPVWIAAPGGLHFDVAVLVDADHAVTNGIAHIVDSPILDFADSGLQLLRVPVPEGRKHTILKTLHRGDPPIRCFELVVERGEVLWNGLHRADGRLILANPEPGEALRRDQRVRVEAQWHTIEILLTEPGTIVRYSVRNGPC